MAQQTRKRQVKPAKHGPTAFETAKRRGIHAIRRDVSCVSGEFITEILDVLAEETMGLMRPFEANSLSVTEVGASRYTNVYMLKGPPTKKLIEGIDSLREPTTCTIGKLAIVGNRIKQKLSFQIVAPTLITEVLTIEDNAEQSGYPLSPEINSDDGEFHAHLSIGTVFSDTAPYFDSDFLGQLDKQLDVIGAETILSRYNTP